LIHLFSSYVLRKIPPGSGIAGEREEDKILDENMHLSPGSSGCHEVFLLAEVIDP
jgi:hypothetical protein